MPTKNNKICSEHFQSGRPSNDVNHPDYIPSKFSFRNQKLGRSRSKAMQRNASLKKESELLKPPAVELHEREKQYNCGICHETFDEVPLFKAHVRSVHVGHKAPFFTISFKEKAKSVKAPTTSTPVNLPADPMESMPLNFAAEEIRLDSPTEPIQVNLAVVPMQLNLPIEPNGYQNDFEEKKLHTNLIPGNFSIELMPPTEQILLDFPTEPIQFDLPTAPMQLNLPTLQNDYQSPYLPMESIQLDLPTDPLQLNFPTEPMKLDLPTVPIQYNLPTETNALHLQNARPCGENMDYLQSENVADLEKKDDSVNEIIETNFEEVIEPLKKQYRGKLCCVDNCRNREGFVNNIGFFKLRRENKSQFDSWMQAINKRNPDGTSWVPGQHAKICGEHFKSGKPSTAIKSPDYVPSLFLPTKLDPPRKLDIVANYDGKKPFKCDICSARYTTKENLNRHFLIEHD